MILLTSLKWVGPQELDETKQNAALAWYGASPPLCEPQGWEDSLEQEVQGSGSAGCLSSLPVCSRGDHSPGGGVCLTSETRLVVFSYVPLL